MPRTVELIQRDDERLKGVHPRLADAIRKTLVAMDVLGFQMFVVEGLRTMERQREHFAKGRTTVGPNATPADPLGATVTNADGVQTRSNHQAKADGLGYAVDCAFVDDPTTSKIETYDPKQPWELYGLMAEKLGMRWGGRWMRRTDMPHVEMPYDEHTLKT